MRLRRYDCILQPLGNVGHRPDEDENGIARLRARQRVQGAGHQCVVREHGTRDVDRVARL